MDDVEFKFEGIYRPERRKDLFNIFLTAVATAASMKPTYNSAPLLCRSASGHDQIPDPRATRSMGVNEAIQHAAGLDALDALVTSIQGG